MRKYEFRPDRTEGSIISKLYLTKKQRLSLLKWVLAALLMVVLSVIQDAIMSTVRIFGSTTDLLPCGIVLMCLALQSENGSVFALLASCFYYCSGTAPGPQVIVLLTALGVAAHLLLQNFLRKGFFSTFLCAGAAMMSYELLLFVLGVFLGSTTWSRFGVFAVCGGLSVAVIPLLYPITRAIAKIGGDSWNE